MTYGLTLAGLMMAGRRADARAIARFIPDCLWLFRRLVRDRRVPRARKVMLAAVIGYLAMPVDIIPDFIPVVGHLDDAVVVALALRSVLRAAGPDVVRQHWRGGAASLEALLRLAGTPDRRRH